MGTGKRFSDPKRRAGSMGWPKTGEGVENVRSRQALAPECASRRVSTVANAASSEPDPEAYLA
jgi:hypothetical protein